MLRSNKVYNVCGFSSAFYNPILVNFTLLEGSHFPKIALQIRTIQCIMVNYVEIHFLKQIKKLFCQKIQNCKLVVLLKFKKS